ncbi:hypothetical protein CK203_030413 [Vitis vinifera]|uniref:Uncharacterized protein n=1 Tax=Vitis vinifera TaxID=29760 RepID=A0A438IV87_VITVI|nr:hypothetical protein CK203_030413 [Vitis vinifera]
MSIFRMPKSVVKRLEKLQRDFLWGGGNTGRKIHLVNWKVVCTQKDKGGLGIRRMGLLNKPYWAVDLAFCCREGCLVEEGHWGEAWVGGWGLEIKGSPGAFCVGVWKEILKEMGWCWNNMKFKVGRGIRLGFGLIIGVVMKRCPKCFLRFSPWLHAEMQWWMRCGTQGLAKEGGISGWVETLMTGAGSD